MVVKEDFPSAIHEQAWVQYWIANYIVYNAFCLQIKEVEHKFPTQKQM